MSRLGWRHCLVIGVLGLAAYVPSLFKGFVFDDHLIIEAFKPKTRLYR